MGRLNVCTGARVMGARLSERSLHCGLLTILAAVFLPVVAEAAAEDELTVVAERDVPVEIRDRTLLRIGPCRPDRGGPYPVPVRRSWCGGDSVTNDLRTAIYQSSEADCGSLWHLRRHRLDGQILTARLQSRCLLSAHAPSNADCVSVFKGKSYDKFENSITDCTKRLRYGPSLWIGG